VETPERLHCRSAFPQGGIHASRRNHGQLPMRWMVSHASTPSDWPLLLPSRHTYPCLAPLTLRPSATLALTEVCCLSMRQLACPQRVAPRHPLGAEFMHPGVSAVSCFMMVISCAFTSSDWPLLLSSSYPDPFLHPPSPLLRSPEICCLFMR